jgi:hypothetical protein
LKGGEVTSLIFSVQIRYTAYLIYNL